MSNDALGPSVKCTGMIGLCVLTDRQERFNLVKDCPNLYLT